MLLTEEQIKLKLSDVSSWSRVDDRIERSFTFHDFEQCVTFFNAIAEIARELNHHPEFFNSFKTCKVSLTTHDLGGLSDLDFTFAHKIDLLYGK